MRFIRKHRVALLALLLYHFAFFFPTLFMARVVSPNDVFYNYDPWASVRTVDVQNALLNDPPTAYFTLMSLVKSDWHAFHWNPFVASGIPGFGSSAAAVLSPFIFFPALVLPLVWVYTGIILLKLNFAFLFAYLWLREERLGKGAAAVGAILFAASGAIAVRWLWQATNAAALYPALLWIACRTARGKRTPFWSVVLIALSYALAGFPAAMAYGAWVAGVYFMFLLIRKNRRGRLSSAGKVGIAFLLALVIAAPSLVPFVQFVHRTGYLAGRANAALEHAFPLRHFLMFLRPDRLGNFAYHNWNGDRALGILNNYVEATVYLGLIAIPLIVLAIPNRRARMRWFWFGCAAVVLACMFGFSPLLRVIGTLPGFKYSPLTRLQILLPLPAAYLASAGAAWIIRKCGGGRPRSPGRPKAAAPTMRMLIASVLAVIGAGDLAVFAGRFYPYLEPGIATPPVTPTIAFLQRQPKPFRIAPFFIELWPNSSELFRLEDVRSHFSSEAKYRQLLQRIDPTSFGGNSTVITFNSLKFDFADPLVSMLGVRYFLENRDIEIIKWTTFKGTVPGVKAIGAMVFPPGAVMQRHVRIDADPFYAIELPARVEQQSGVNARVNVWLLRGSEILFGRAFTAADIAVMEKMYVPVRPFARVGETLTLRIQSVGLRLNMLKGVATEPGDASLFYGRVTTPVIFDRQLPDGRLFLNTAEIPRFHAVARLRKLDDAAFLAAKDIDFGQEAVVTDAGGIAGATLSPAVVTLKRYAEDEQQIDVRADGPAFLASSEKLTPELRVTVDGRVVNPVEINMLFAGVPLQAGTHHVVFSRRIGRGWWWWSVAALIAAIALSIIDVVRRG